MRDKSTWDERRARDLARAGVAVLDSDTGALYRPGELLLDPRSIDLLRSETKDARVRSDDECNHRLALAGVELQRWLIPRDFDLPALQRTLGAQLKRLNRPECCVELNHVLTGEPFYKGGPGGEPQPRASPPMPAAPALAAGAVPALAILDTGLPLPRPPQLVASLVADDGTDVDLLDEDEDEELDTEAGHGTFIGGLVQRLCGGLAVEHRTVLDSYGFGDDLTVCLGLAEETAPVVNMSLGGYTCHDHPSAALAAAVRARRHDTVVVAAAGNNGSNRPFYPAALPGVVAVAAYDSRSDSPASFSNHGDWVDVCAPGVALLSCYVDGARGVGADRVLFTGGAIWSGTSFAAPLVAAEIARRVAADASRPPRKVANDLLAELSDSGWPGFGVRFDPGVDLTV